MKVVLADVNEADLENAEEKLRGLGGTVLAVLTDVAKRSDIEALARKTLETFGAVHLLVNNAGVGAGSSPWEATWNDWEWTIGVDLWGVIHGVKVFTPLMLAQNAECHIVNTSSVAGLTSGGEMTPYTVSKHAVVALSECLYLSLQQRNALVKVSVLCPGFVRTNINTAERNRPLDLRNKPTEVSPPPKDFLDFMNAAIEAGLSPLQVADQVLDAVRHERFYILTDPRWIPAVKLRVDSLLRLENPPNPFETVMSIVESMR